MKINLIGLALIIIGIALIVWGYDIYDSAGAQVSRAFNGETPVKAWAGMVGGAICVLIGILKVK